MSQLRLELRQNPHTGCHDLVVKLDSDRDLTSHEHESLHRKLVNQLVGSGLFEPGGLGGLIVERHTSGLSTATTATEAPAQRPAARESSS